LNFGVCGLVSVSVQFPRENALRDTGALVSGAAFVQLVQFGSASITFGFGRSRSVHLVSTGSMPDGSR